MLSRLGPVTLKRYCRKDDAISSSRDAISTSSASLDSSVCGSYVSNRETNTLSNHPNNGSYFVKREQPDMSLKCPSLNLSVDNSSLPNSQIASAACSSAAAGRLINDSQRDESVSSDVIKRVEVLTNESGKPCDILTISVEEEREEGADLTSDCNGRATERVWNCGGEFKIVLAERREKGAGLHEEQRIDADVSAVECDSD